MSKYLSVSMPLLGLAATGLAGTPIDRLAPEDAIVVVSIDNAERTVERVKKTELWALWQSAEIQALRADAMDEMHEALDEMLAELGVDEDALVLPAGPSGFAIFPVVNDDLVTEPGFLFAADFESNADQFSRLVDAAMEKAEEKGQIEIDRDDLLGRTVYTLDLSGFEMDDFVEHDAIPRDPFQLPGPDVEEMVPDEVVTQLETVYYVRDGSNFLMTSHLDAMGDALEVLDGEDADSVSGNEEFRAVRGRLGDVDGYAVVLTEGIVNLLAGDDPMGAMVEGMVRTIVGDIRGIGVGVQVDSSRAMIEEKVVVYMPEGKSGLTALLDTPAPRRRTPGFVAPGLISYSSFNFEFEGIIELLNKIGRTNPMIQQQIDMVMQEHGRTIEQVTSALGPDVHTLAKLTRPLGIDSLKQMFVIRCTQRDQVEPVLTEYLGQFLNARDFLGHRIYSTPINPMAPGGMFAGPSGDGFSIGFGGGYVFLGYTSMVEDGLRAAGGGNLPTLEDDPTFRRALRLLPDDEVVAWGVMNPIDYVEYLKDLDTLTQQQMIAQVRQWNPEAAEEMKAEFAAQEAPPWRNLDLDLFRRHLGPVVWEVRAPEDGFVATSSLLAPD